MLVLSSNVAIQVGLSLSFLKGFSSISPCLVAIHQLLKCWSVKSLTVPGLYCDNTLLYKSKSLNSQPFLFPCCHRLHFPAFSFRFLNN